MWRKLWHKLPRWARHRSFLIPTGVAVILAGGYFFVWGGGNGVEAVVAERGEVIELVTVSGKTKAGSEVDLGFEKSGRVGKVGARAGDKVVTGQIIVALESDQLSANLLEARATLTAEEIKLQELKRGLRPEELAVSEAEAAAAKADLVESVRNAFIEADNAVRNKADTFFGGRRPDWRDNLVIYIDDVRLIDDLISQREEIEKLLDAWAKAVNSPAGISPSTVTTYLASVNQFLTLLASGVNELEADSNNEFSQTEVDSYKATASSARTAVVDALSDLTSKITAFNTASRELELDKTGNSTETIATQEAKVEQARAKVLDISAQLRNNLVVSPINGVVAKQEAETGEIITAGETIVTVISEGNLEVESYIPEVYVANVKINNEVAITLDAAPTETYRGVVTYIDPAETLQGGVPNYKIKVALTDAPADLKSGLTANLQIETARKDNVVRLPRFALMERENNFYVRRQTNKGVVITPVNIGLLGTDGMVEIKSGLTAGETVLIDETKE